MFRPFFEFPSILAALVVLAFVLLFCLFVLARERGFWRDVYRTPAHRRSWRHPSLRFASVGLVLILGACQTTAQSVAMTSSQALVAAESAVDTALVAVTVALQAKDPTALAHAKEIAALTAPCANTTTPDLSQCPVQGTLILAQRAQKAADATSMATLGANLMAYVTELAGLHG